MIEATSRFGMLTGMVMPVVMLPSVFTGSLAMLATPALAARENNHRALKAVIIQLLAAAFVVGVACGIIMYAAAPWIAISMYRLPELVPLIRYLCPSVLLMSLQQVLSGMIAGLGRQKQALYGTIVGAFITLAVSWFLTGLPEMRLFGAALAMMGGQVVGLVWSIVLLIWILVKKTPLKKEREIDQPARILSGSCMNTKVVFIRNAFGENRVFLCISRLIFLKDDVLWHPIFLKDICQELTICTVW